MRPSDTPYEVEEKRMTTSSPSPREESGKGASLRRRVFNLPNLFSAAIAVSIVYFLVAKFDFDLSATWGRVEDNNFLWYGLAFLSYYLIFPLRGLRWRHLLENVGCFANDSSRNLPVTRLSELSFLGWFVNTVTVFRMGFVYRCYHASRDTGSSFALIAGSLLSERIIDTILTFAFMLITALALLKTPAASIAGPVLLSALIACALLAGIALVLAASGVNPGRLVPDKYRSGYADFRHGTLKSFQRWPWLAVLSIGIWACESARLYMIVEALDYSVDLPLLLFVALAASLITSFPITPGGLGLVEASMTGLLATGLPWEQAVSIALLDRSVNYLSVVILGSGWFLFRSVHRWEASPALQPVTPMND